MAQQNPPSSSTNIIPLPSRHNKNFEQYITDYAVTHHLTMAGEVWETALAAAKRLDYAQREGRVNKPNMTLVPAQAGLFGRVLGFFRRTQQEPPLSELDDIRAFLAQAKDAQQSQINWGSLRNGFGSWMKARLLPGGQQKGSSPTPRYLRDRPSWQLLSKRKQLNGRTLYVRGHLLHDAAGGPGVDYNLTPLTAASGGDFGANHANLAHRYAVESVILGALDRGIIRAWAFLAGLLELAIRWRGTEQTKKDRTRIKRIKRMSGVLHCKSLFGIVNHCKSLFGIVNHCKSLFGIVWHCKSL